MLYDFALVVRDAGAQYSPALIASYVYDLAKEFNQYYHDYPVLKEADPEKRMFRLQLCAYVARVIRKGMELLGAAVPDKM